MPFSITAVDTRTGQVQQAAELLGDAYGVTYLTRSDANDACQALESSKRDYGHDAVAYRVDGSSTADDVAARLGEDGLRFTTPDGRTLEELAEAAGGVRERHRRKPDVVRYAFADGSAITVAGDAWDVGFLGCWCWEGAGHSDECPA